MEIKKIRIPEEIAYAVAAVLLALSVAMISAADYGVSMVVAPAYILSVKFDFLTFGQGELIVQGILFAVLCIVLKKFKVLWLCSFASGVLYGAVLDLWRTLPSFNPDITAPGSMSTPLRIFYLVAGMILTSFSISLFFKTYFLPQVYEFFVKGISRHFKKDNSKVKIAFDFCFLIISVIMSLALFKKLVGIGIATVIMAFLNGIIIGLFNKLLGKTTEFYPLFGKRFSERFTVE